MKKIRFFSLIGLGGIDPSESVKARSWEHRFDIGLFPVAMFALLAWYSYKRDLQFISPDMQLFSDWLLWGFFVVELIALSCLVKNRWRYLRDNWFNIVIIVVALPTLWDVQALGMLRAIRFLLVALMLANLSSTIRVVLSRNHLGLTVLATWVFVFCAGVIMAAIEPEFKNMEDGIWWAWATVTTVGYGDVVPATSGGRLLAGLVMLLGLGIFSLITANFSAFFVSREELKMVKKEDKILEHLQKIEERLHALEKAIPNKNKD